jgi:acetyl esterase/lipase
VLNRRKLLQSALYKGTAICSLPAIIALGVSPAVAKTGSKKTVSYGSHKLDIYPAQLSGASARKKAPIIVYVHGGAWRGGSRSSVGSKAKYFTASGKVFISVGYTLYPSANALQQARQIGKAVSWIRANASSFNGDARRIILMGHSAGSHLAALAVFSGAARGVRALICNDTRAYDLPLLASRNGGQVPLLYSALGDKKNWKNWSPISYVGRGNRPPTLIAWSSGSGRKSISQHFANSLRSAGGRVATFDGSSKYSHGSINSSIGRDKGGITAAITRFIAQNGG